jgi:hypothetical protein
MIGDIQNLDNDNPDAAGSIDLYAPDGAKWAQMNYGNYNYIVLKDDRASIQVNDFYWNFFESGETELPGDLIIPTTGTLILGSTHFPSVSGDPGHVLTINEYGDAVWQAPTGTSVSDNIDASTLSGTTLNSTITGSSLTSVGTLANLTVTNTIEGSITGNAATATTAITAATAETASTATKLATAININGVTFDGSEDITITALVDAGTLTGTTLKSTITGSSLTSVGTLANLTVTDAIVGSIIGNAATATTATTATKLATARNINGVAFDGSENITITASADAGTLTGTTLKSTITGSSLTSVGTIANLTTGGITNSGKLIVGATSAASSSAVLEASSTTQGFLPPRLNYYQRTQIASPIPGLTIWCSNCGASGEMQVFNGAAWTNMIGGTATGTISLSIGSNYQGGKIAYIFVDGDPGYDENTQHGLIAATSDQSTGIQWYNGSNTNTGATGTAIGTGLSNTNTIIKSQGGASTDYAAALARTYNGGGYTDWYLPSKDELNKLYLQRIAIGGFTTNSYWTSSEVTNTSATFQDFFTDTSEWGSVMKYATTLYVRAVRSF